MDIIYDTNLSQYDVQYVLFVHLFSGLVFVF